MKSKFEAPELTMIGQANKVVMGQNTLGNDAPLESAPDFEFEQDSL